MIGQESLVQTISNAIKQNRIAGAFLLTGIRGTGKTTTARIIAKALNCTANNDNSPNANPCGICENCKLIGQGRHPDILEMDAASRTGVDDIREIIDNVCYAPAMARFKVYIIDEVHMLSKNAFNALLKTLEEPPSHVKFIFATTEIRKIPVTILSRCQRYELKRITIETLSSHLKKIIGLENIAAEENALILIAKIAEGSVRDALSILDQAIVHADGTITYELVSNMIGLGSKEKLLELYKLTSSGNITEAIDLLNALYNNGLEVTQLFQDLLELIHLLSKAKITPDLKCPLYLSQEEFNNIKNLSIELELSYLTRSWQLIINSLEELKRAAVDLIAGEMLLIKLSFMSDLPSPAKVIRQLENQINTPNNFSIQNKVTHNVTTTSSSLAQNIEYALDVENPLKNKIDNFAQMVELFKKNGEILLHSWLINEVRLVKYAFGQVEVNLSDSLPANFTQRLSNCLNDWTKTRWMIVVSKEKGLETLSEQKINHDKMLKEKISNLPEVREILNLFPGSTVTKVENL